MSYDPGESLEARETRRQALQEEWRKRQEEDRKEEQEYVVNAAVSVALELNTVLDPEVAPDRLADVIAHAIPRVITPAEEVKQTCLYMKTHQGVL